MTPGLSVVPNNASICPSSSGLKVSPELRIRALGSSGPSGSWLGVLLSVLHGHFDAPSSPYAPPDIYSVYMPTWRGQWHPTPVLLPGKSRERRSLVGCSPWVHEELNMTERPHFHFSLSCIGEGNGNPLQCSRLENPRDGRA